MCRQFSDLLAEYPIDPNDKITSRITPRDHTIVIYVKLSACQSHCERDSVVMSVSFVILSLGFDSVLISGGNTFTQDRSIAGGLRRLHTDRMIRRKKRQRVLTSWLVWLVRHGRYDLHNNLL